jgi:hypothetical protein
LRNRAKIRKKGVKMDDWETGENEKNEADLERPKLKARNESHDDNCLIFRPRNKRQNGVGPGRPRKNLEDKAKLFGVWLTKEYQELMEKIPVSKGIFA